MAHKWPPPQRPVCVPLCGASKAYGRFDKPWRHERECPVRLAWETERTADPKSSADDPEWSGRRDADREEVERVKRETDPGLEGGGRGD